jgi:hypothetical protein
VNKCTSAASKKRGDEAMKKLGLAVLALLPLAAGCYAETYPEAVYVRPSTVSVYASTPSVYVAPRPVYVAPPAPRVYVAPPAARVYVAPPAARVHLHWR